MELLGSTIAGKYRIDSFLNRGGMGAVYRATQIMLEREVVIKVIRPELVMSKESISRFQREARAASQLSHPNIVNVFDLGETEDGSLYIAMELVDGISLAELLAKEGTLEPSRAAKLIEGVCSALSLAHQKGVVHRDLKPANIMVVTDRDGNESPKILDFGIAKTYDAHASGLTATGMMLGTPHYMSPEQASAQEVDGRADIYALGIILFEMLTGKVAFTADTPMAVLFKHMGETPQPPSALQPGVPSALDAIVLRCLEKEREKRFGSAKDLAKALASDLDRTLLQPEAGDVLPPPAAQADVDRTRMETRRLEDSSGSNRAGFRWKILAGLAAAIVAIAAVAWFGTRGGGSEDRSQTAADTGVIEELGREGQTGAVMEADETAPAERRAEQPVGEQERESVADLESEGEQEAALSLRTQARGDLANAILAAEENRVRTTRSSLRDLLGSAAAGDPDLANADSWLAGAQDKRQREQAAQETRERLAAQELGERQERDARGNLAAAIGTSDENAVRRASGSLRDLLGSAAASDTELTSAATWLASVENARQDRAMWSSIQGSERPEQFEAYLRTYPNGLFADEVRRRLPDLRAADEYRLGSGYFDGRDYERAVPHFRRACDGGNVDGCFNLALMYKNGQAVAQDHDQAVSMFRKACDGGSAPGCSSLGVMYEEGQGVTQDHEEAVSLYGQACDGGSAVGCTNLGRKYEYGEGVAKSLARAEELHRQACDRGNETACDRLKELQ